MSASAGLSVDSGARPAEAAAFQAEHSPWVEAILTIVSSFNSSSWLIDAARSIASYSARCSAPTGRPNRLALRSLLIARQKHWPDQLLASDGRHFRSTPKDRSASSKGSYFALLVASEPHIAPAAHFKGCRRRRLWTVTCPWRRGNSQLDRRLAASRNRYLVLHFGIGTDQLAIGTTPGRYE